VAPLVSVVIATHDRAELFPRAVASILRQTLQDFELVIVDDASSDATPVVVQELQNRDPRIRSFRTDTNVGPGAARNLGVHHARGTYGAILDDDDLALPERLALQTEQFTHDPGLGLVFSSVAWVDGRGETFAIMHEVVRTGHFPRTPPEVFSLL
jgi:glycosyltransferase involved in cell wall biosynthesis